MKRMHGFTLIELIMTMVLIAIVSVVSVQFLGRSISLYSDSADQQHRISDARFILERLSRELAQSHPFSVRDPFASNASYQGKCLEYIRLSAVGSYRQSATSGTELLMRDWPHDHLQSDAVYALTAGRRLSIDTESADELYQSGTSGSVQSILGVTPGTSTVTLGSAFTKDSNGKRFTVLDQTGPTMWCLFDQKLYRFASYNTDYGSEPSADWFASTASNAPTSQVSLMAERVSSSSAFNIQSATLDHNTMVDVTLRLFIGQSTDPLIFNRRLQVNYVP